MNCERCTKPPYAEFFDRWPCYVVRAYKHDARPVFTRLCNTCVKLAIDGGAMVEVDILGYPSTRLWKKLQTLVGCDRVPQETQYYVRLAEYRKARREDVEI